MFWDVHPRKRSMSVLRRASSVVQRQQFTLKPIGPVDPKLSREHPGDLKVKSSQNPFDRKSNMAAILNISFALLK